MFVLKHAQGDIYNLSTGPEHSVGRLGNLELLNDPSVSRHHACIKVSVKNGRFHVKLHDSGSKYGTYVNEGIAKSKEISKKSAVELKVGDSVRFGQQWNTWKLVEEPFVISTSTLSGTEKSYVSKIAAKLNGIVVADWANNCTHLTMNKIKITAKVVCAMGHVRPIVTVDYWKHLVAILSSKAESPLPDYVDFIPELAEPLLISSHFDFRMKTERKTLFRDVKFVAFGASQCSSVSPMVEAAGGSVLDGKIFKVSSEQLKNENIIVVQPKSEEVAAANHYLNILKAQRLRPVPESEICLSVASCSLDRYCNPAYDISVLFKQPGTQITIKDDATVLALETQDMADEDTEFQEAPSGSNFSLTVNDNRVFSESDDDEIADSDVSVVQDSGDFSMACTRSTRSSNKRKLEPATEIPSKGLKLDARIIGRKRATNCSDNSESMLSGSAVTKKPINDIFSFGDENKKPAKNSSSLFGGISERLKLNSRNVRGTRNSQQSTSSSLMCGSPPKASEESSASVIAASDDRPTRRSTRSLFAGLNARAEKESPALFSSNDSDLQPRRFTRSNDTQSNKRKMVDDFGPSTSKKANKSTSSLFQPLVTKNKGVRLTVDSDDEPDGSLEKETASKLNISKAKTETAPPMPVVEVPATISLSQFMDVPAGNVNIKTEPLDLPIEVQEVLDKTVVLTVSLMKDSPRAVRTQVDGSKANFKKFRKNEYRKCSQSVIPASALLLYVPKTENEDDDD